MSSSENDAEKIIPESTGYSPTTVLAILIIVAQVLISLATYPFLPNIVPTHWNAAGQIDSYAPKWVNAVLFPAISLGMYILIRVLMSAGPRLGYQQQRGMPQVVNLIVVAVLLLLLVVQLTVTAISLGLPVDITFVLSLSLSVLFMFIGNYMGKLRRNFWAGIRTPWTLASDAAWERTHRLGGWLFVLAGLLGVIMSFVPPLRVWGLVAVIMLAVVATIVYSYVIYQHLITAEGSEPLSPPFDGGEV
jgi:uncharacterized membrane protein